MIDWLERHRRSVLFALALLALGGLAAAWRLPVALFPLIDFPRVVVNVEAGDRPVDRMVVEVTRPLEQALRTVPGVQIVRSTSSRGAADISITFGWGMDMVAALLQAESAVSRALPGLPPGTTFSVRRMDPTIFPVLGLSLVSDRSSLVELTDFATLRLAPLLSADAGVAEVEVLGGRKAEYQILLDPLRLQGFALGPADVAKALAANNVVVAVGRIEDRYRLYLALADTRLRNQDDIAHTVLKTGANGVVTLADVGEVRLGEAPQWTRVNADGHDAVLINIRQQRGANTVAVVAAVRASLKAFAAQTPADIRITPYYDQSDLIVASANSVRDAIALGALLAALVLFAFLRQWRVTLVLAVTLPAVLAITVLLLNVLGMSFNIMTLGGMAAAVGLVLDDGVVMIEHLMRRLAEPPPASAGARAPLLAHAGEMLRPLLGSSLATIVVFVPLAFLSGVAGGFFKALALTMATALAISFFVAMFAVPLITVRLVRREDAERVERGGRVLQAVTARYRGGLQWLFDRPLVVLPLIVLIALAGWLAYSRVGSGFMPVMDEGGFILDYRATPGTALTETDRLLRQVEAIVRDTPEVRSYSRRTGLQLGGGLTEASDGDMFIRLKPPPRRGIEEVMTDIRARIDGAVPGLRVETAQLMEDLIGDLIANPKPVEIKLFGADEASLQRVAATIAARIEKLPGIVEVFNGVTIAGDAVAIRIDRVQAALEGLAPEQVTQQLSEQLAGTVTSDIQSGEKLIGVRVMTSEDLRERLQQLGDLRLRNASGQTLPLRRIAALDIETGQAQIERENLQPMVAVTARLEGIDLGSAVRAIKADLARLPLPAGVYVEYGGIYQQQQQSFQDLTIVFLSALLLVAALLLYLYESLTIVAAILSVTLLSVSGVFLGLWLTGTELNLSAMMGLTMIVGIVTEVAIFYFAEIAEPGRKTHEQLIHAGMKRFRPIVMTTSIAILALLPLALGWGEGAEMQKPLAISIISGLIVALPLVLLVMPCIYRLLLWRSAEQP